MLIPADVLAGIAAGEVTLAFRRWARPRVKEGTRLRTAVGVIAIDAIEVIEREDISDADARKAGSTDAEAIHRFLDRREGQRYRIHLSHAGADPRVALREHSDLTTAEVDELRAALERFDQTSRHGPWTRAFLDVIADRPATLAADLAASLDLDKPWFKRHVRKLKELGLTESLPTGYQLSPRGRALHDHLRQDG